MSSTMGTRLLFLGCLFAPSLARDIINVNVGKEGLTFEPSSVQAPAGSIINFHFYPGDHSVAQSTYNNPCEPSGPDALYSGFLNPQSGVDATMFTVTINNTAPLWLYCSQSGHCQSGMVMVVNPPNTGDTLNGYINAAAKTQTSGSPERVGGGIFQPNSAADPSQSSGSGSSSGTIESPFLKRVSTLRTAHGAIMALCAILLFPLGALWMRLLGFTGLVWFHAGWQLFSLALLTCGFSIGVVLARDLSLLYTGLGKTHTSFGTVLFAIIWLQTLLGFTHHFQYVKKQSRTVFTYLHIWYGRALLILLIINGGLGVKLVADLGSTSDPRSVEIAYGVVAGVMGVVYITLTTFNGVRELKKRNTTTSSLNDKENTPSN